MTEFKTPTEFALAVINMPIRQREAFYETLKETLSEEDYLTTVKFISFNDMYYHETKYNALKNAVLEVLCEEFFGHTVEPQKKLIDPCNPVYMTTIL